MSDRYLEPLTQRLPTGVPIAVLESGWPAECGLLKGCPWEAGPLHQLTYARAAQKLAAKTVADGHPIRVSSSDYYLPTLEDVFGIQTLDIILDACDRHLTGASRV